jgi:modulator of FtsH protease
MHLLGLLTRLGIHLAAADPPGYAVLRERWHDFFMLSGTAAVTLAGLLFVSMSFNMEHLLRADRQPLLQFARTTMLVYLLVLVLSLMMLMPDWPMRALGLQLVFVGLLLVVFSAFGLWRLLRDPESVFTRRHRVRRGLPAVASGFLLVGAGVGFMRGQLDAHLGLFAAICLMLATGVWSSWDLLVVVARAGAGRHTHPG